MFACSLPPLRGGLGRGRATSASARGPPPSPSLPPCGGESSLCSLRRFRLLPFGKRSRHLVHVDHDAVGMTHRRSDEQVFHQPAVFFGTRLKLRHRAEIDQLGIDRLATLQTLQQFDRSKTDALVLDIDHRAVVGFERIFCFQFDQLVGPDDLEVRAERADLAVDVVATHLATGNRDDAADAVTDIADGCHAADIGGDGENMFGQQLRRRHEKPFYWSMILSENRCPPIGSGARGQAFPDHAHPIMRCGSQVASNGNRIKITSRMRSVTTNGITPLKIVANDTSLTTLLITKTFIPTGGWMRPSSTVITMITPNQIGSKPRWVITGKMIGTVRMIMAIASIRQPSTRYITMMRARMP